MCCCTIQCFRASLTLKLLFARIRPGISCAALPRHVLRTVDPAQCTFDLCRADKLQVTAATSRKERH